MEHAFQIRLFFGTAAIFAAYEAVKAAAWQRWLFWGLTATFAVIAFFWSAISGLYAPATNILAAVGTNTETWVVLFALVMLAAYASGKEKPKKPAPKNHNAREVIPATELQPELRNEIAAAESRADQALARHAASNARDKSEVSNAIAGIEDRVGKLEIALAEIRPQIAVDLPNATTVVQAFENLDEAVHHQVRRVEQEAERINETARRADQDTLFLLDWAAGRASANVVAELARSQPKFDKANPPQDEDERGAAFREIGDWLSTVSSGIGDVNYNAEIERVLRNSRHEGEALARQVPPELRPSNVDPLVFADFFALAYQSEMTGICLRNVVSELNKSDRAYLNRLREQLRARKKA